MKRESSTGVVATLCSPLSRVRERVVRQGRERGFCWAWIKSKSPSLLAFGETLSRTRERGTATQVCPHFGSRQPLNLVVIAAVMLGSCGLAQAQTPEAKLRDQLRQSVTELRQVQDENAALKAELDNLRRNGPAPVAVAPTPPPAAAAPAIDPAELRKARASASNEAARAKQLEEQLTATQKVLVQWQDSQKQAAQLARTRDADARELEMQLKQTTETVNACEAKNATLVSIADELVGRYRSKGTLASVNDREPLLGMSRKYEVLAQEYRGRIIDASVKLPTPTPSNEKTQ